MSSIKVQGNASGTGSVTLASPNTNNNITLTMPSALGSAGQSLITDASGNISYGPGGGTSTTSAVDITLTSASTQVQFVTMTATGQSVIMPNATTMTKGSTVFEIVNDGTIPFDIKDASGFRILQGVEPYQAVQVTLVDNSTSTGKWAKNGVNFATSQGNVNSYQTDRSGMLTIGSSNASTISNTSGAFKMDCATLSSSQALIFYGGGNNFGAVVLATISGNTVTFGTPVTIFSATYSFQVNDNGPIAVGLSSTSAVVFGKNGNTVVGWAISVSGSTVTVGSPTSSGLSAATAGNYVGLNAIADSSSTGVLCATNNAAAITVGVQAFSVSGTTLTFGSASTNILNNFGSQPGNARMGKVAANTYVVVGTDSGSGVIRHRAFTVSGTTITLGTTITSETISGIPGLSNFVQSIQSNYTGYIAPGSNWLIFPSVVGLALQYSGTTYQAGSTTYGGNWTQYPSRSLRLAQIGTNTVAGPVMITGGGDKNSMYLMVFSGYAGNMSGASYIPIDTASPFFSPANSSATAFGESCCALDSSTLLVVFCRATSTTSSTFYLQAQVIKFNY